PAPALDADVAPPGPVLLPTAQAGDDNVGPAGKAHGATRVRRRPDRPRRGKSSSAPRVRRRYAACLHASPRRSAGVPAGHWRAAQPRKPGTTWRAESVSGSSRGTTKLVTHY